MAHPDPVTFPFKNLFISMVSLLALAVISGAFYLQNDPRFKLPALVANGKHWMYAATFHAENALGAANTLSGLPDDADAPQSGGARSIPILVYHGILDEPDGSTINLTEEQFKDQIFALKRRGYEAITLEELYAFGKEGAALPDRPILITFDDGRTDSFYNGDPVLAAVKYNAVMFPIGKYTRIADESGSYYLSEDEIKFMVRTGRWAMGSHSDQGHEDYPINEQGEMGHYFSNHLWKAEEHRAETPEEFSGRIIEDFKSSRSYLEDLLGVPISSFAFPFGDLGQNQKDAREKTDEIIRSASEVYNVLFYQQRPGMYFTQLIPSKDEGDLLLVRRINMNNSWSPEDLLNILEDGMAKALPYHDSFDNDNGWLRVWGEHTTENGTLTMQASPLQTGASTVLDGSEIWEDYEVSAVLTSPAQTGVNLWVRFKDDNHNAGCNFGKNFAFVEQAWNGEKRVLKGIERENLIPAGQFTIAARVEGRTLICSLSGEELVRSEFLEPKLDRGGIGIKIWDEALGKSAVIIEQLEVETIKSE